MGSMIDKYDGLKRAHYFCARWASLIGSPYSGGRGGIGKIHSVGQLSPVVYHQAYDGATNYHDMPKELAPYLESAIKAKFSELLADAMAMQKADLKEAAKLAAKEYADLMRVAGLEEPLHTAAKDESEKHEISSCCKAPVIAVGKGQS